jgi:hypothetical protein
MAAQVFGTAHLFGIAGSIADATVLSFSDASSFALADETKNESGVTIERHYNDRQNDVSITIKQQAAYVQPSIGDTLAYNSITYEIVASSASEENQGFRVFELTMKKSEGVAY